MNDTGTVLHLQKVAGISGSEAHLLALLPRLKERGWDVRFLMLHEHEPGAWDFARELTARSDQPGIAASSSSRRWNGCHAPSVTFDWTTTRSPVAR